MSMQKAVIAALALSFAPALALAQEHTGGCGAGCGSGSMTTTTNDPPVAPTKTPDTSATKTKPAKANPKARKIEVAVTDEGFVPAKISVKKGELVQLVVTRKTDATCAKAIVIKDQKVNADLPLNTPVTVDVKTDKAGNIHFACPMDMITGDITVN